jgi:chitinase
VLDRINIMTYDIGGAWNPQTGANSPLNPGPNGGDSFNTAIEFWTSAGVPANKLTGGLPFYGRSTSKLLVVTYKEKETNYVYISSYKRRYA